MSQVNWRKPLILAVLLFVLGSFAYWVEFKQKPKKEEQEEQAKKLFALKDKAVQSILLFVNGKTLEFKCSDLAQKLCKPGDNSKWEIAAPSKLKADDSAVNSLISTLNNINSSETIDLKEETPEKRAALLKEYGLDPQARTNDRRIEVTTAGGTTTLFLGFSHPIGEMIFGVKAEGADSGKGKIDENHVYLVPNYFKANFDKELTYWRDKKLLTIAAHQVQGFALESSKGKVSGERQDGKWTLTSKYEQYPGDIENIDSFLSSATYLSAKDFASDDKTDKKARAVLKGAKPILKLTLKTASSVPAPTPSATPQAVQSAGPSTGITLTLFKKGKTDKLYATVSNLDPLFELETKAKDRLEKDLKDLRLVKLITSMERFSAKRLEFSGTPVGTPPLVLVNTDGKWLSQLDKTEVDAEKVQKFLDKLSGNRIKDFVIKNIPAGEERGLRLTLGDDKENAKRQFVFWKSGDKFYARDLTAKRKEAFLIDSAVERELPWDRAHAHDFFKSAKVGPSPAPVATAKK